MGILDSFKTLVSKKGEAPAQVNIVPSTKKVLIVDDDVMLRQLYSELLTNEGFTTVTAENGLVGLQLIQSENPDLVLLDLMMPVMDGKTVLQKLKDMQGYENLPVIILTNAGDIDSMHETRFYKNALEFLIKSNVTPEDIVAKVRAHLP